MSIPEHHRMTLQGLVVGLEIFVPSCAETLDVIIRSEIEDGLVSARRADIRRSEVRCVCHGGIGLLLLCLQSELLPEVGILDDGGCNSCVNHRLPWGKLNKSTLPS